MTAAQLRKAAARLERAAAAADTARAQRDSMVWEALVEGWTHTQIAAATGLTRGRVNQLARMLD